MARYTDAVCKLCRRQGIKLFLKGDRCHTEKCAVTRRPYPPGQHGQARKKHSEYAVRLREKQKVRNVYGVLEKQFRDYYFEAARRSGRTGEEMLGLLERRFDNVVYRLGFTFTRPEARQLIVHNHFRINGKKMNIPSYIVKPGDKIQLGTASQTIKEIVAALAKADARPQFSWLELNKEAFSGTLKSLPVREELRELEASEQLPHVREQLIVEYYSR